MNPPNIKHNEARRFQRRGPIDSHIVPSAPHARRPQRSQRHRLRSWRRTIEKERRKMNFRAGGIGRREMLGKIHFGNQFGVTISESDNAIPRSASHRFGVDHNDRTVERVESRINQIRARVNKDGMSIHIGGNRPPRAFRRQRRRSNVRRKIKSAKLLGKHSLAQDQGRLMRRKLPGVIRRENARGLSNTSRIAHQSQICRMVISRPRSIIRQEKCERRSQKKKQSRNGNQNQLINRTGSKPDRNKRHDTRENADHCCYEGTYARDKYPNRRPRKAGLAVKHKQIIAKRHRKPTAGDNKKSIPIRFSLVHLAIVERRH